MHYMAALERFSFLSNASDRFRSNERLIVINLYQAVTHNHFSLLSNNDLLWTFGTFINRRLLSRWFFYWNRALCIRRNRNRLSFWRFSVRWLRDRFFFPFRLWLLCKFSHCHLISPFRALPKI